LAFKNVFPKMVKCYVIMWKNITDPDRPHMTIKYVACALHTGFLWLQTHTQNKQYSLFFHCNNSCTKAPHRYVISTWPVLFFLRATRRLSKYRQFPSPVICHLVGWFMDGTVFEEPVPHPLWIFLWSIDNTYQNLRCFQLESHNLYLYLSDDLRSCIIFTSFSFCILIY
jgi:hypothetical protein